jgi:hypothetical protein
MPDNSYTSTDDKYRLSVKNLNTARDINEMDPINLLAYC